MGRKLRATLEEARQMYRVNRLRYKSEMLFIERVLEDILVIPMTDIWIYPAYPDGFQAVVGGLEIDEETDEDFVYIMDVVDGLVTIDRHEPRGFYPNGSLRFKEDRYYNERDKLRDRMFDNYTYYPT